jgi:hypothetical protein
MKSKELKEIEAEEMDQEPSLDKMVDLNDPKVLSGLGRLATEARLRQEAASQSAQHRTRNLRATNASRPDPLDTNQV